MDMTWVTDRIAVGGGIWNEAKMSEVVRAGVTHIINMQIEFDDRPLAEPYGIEVLWTATDDDFEPKSEEMFIAGAEFAAAALMEPENKVFIHCAAGVHRAPMMTLAVMCSLGWDIKEARRSIETLRPVVDFADVYVRSVENFLRAYGKQKRATTRNT